MARYSCTSLRVLCGALLLLAVGCSQQQPPAPDTRAVDEAAIRKADTAWSEAAAARNVDGMVAYYSDDASLMRDQAPVAKGKDAIRSAWDESFQSPDFTLQWQPANVEVARSGDLGYSQGTYETSAKDAKGKPITDRGKYVVLWKKQGDGSWKAIADIANSDLSSPAVPPSRREGQK